MRQPAGLTQESFEQLLARAVELDDAGHERIDLDRARTIALEVGVSANSWDAALRERQQLSAIAPVVRTSASTPGRSSRNPSKVALVGGVLGMLAGMAAPLLGDAAIAAGALAIAAGIALTFEKSHNQSKRSRSLTLMAWWAAIPTGIMLGMREPHADPIIFGATSWLWCEAVGAALRWYARRLQAKPITVIPDTTHIPR